MPDIEVLDDPATVAVAIDPARARLLAELGQPASAAALAERLGLPRQKINYHLRALETHGLVREAETRRWGGITERRMLATARAYVISPAALGPAAPDPQPIADRLSASYLLALAARAVQEVGALMKKAAKTGRRLATLSIDTEIRFASAEDRAAFSQELAAALAALAARYHQPSAPSGRWHRLVAVAYPSSGDDASPSNPSHPPQSES